MIAIEKSKRHYGRCTPNVLPCRVHYNGAVNASKRYWDPKTMPDGKTIAYFRGRKLYGRKLRIPAGYRGIVISSTDRVLPRVGQAQEEEGDVEDEEEEQEPEVKVAEEQAVFKDLMVWGHEALPDDTADQYVKGVEEWIAFAEQIHSFSVDGEEGSSGAK